MMDQKIWVSNVRFFYESTQNVKFCVPQVGEQDLLEDVYGLIKSRKIISNTTATTATASKLGAEYSNLGRSIASKDGGTRQASSLRADLVFSYLSNELAGLEIGRKDKGPMELRK